MIQVRRATLDDVPWLVDQLRLFSKFFGTKRSLFPGDQAAAYGLKEMIRDHIVFVADLDGTGPIGFIGGYYVRHPFNNAIRTLTETFWWTDEEHRGSRAGLMLLNAFLDWGKQNADWILFALETHSPVKQDVLTKRGFHLQESNYLMEVNP